MSDNVTFQNLNEELFKNNEKIRSIVDGQFSIRDKQIDYLSKQVSSMNELHVKVLVQQESIVGSMKSMADSLSGLVNSLREKDEIINKVQDKTSKNSARINWIYAAGSAAFAALVFVGGLVWTVANRIYDLVAHMK